MQNQQWFWLGSQEGSLTCLALLLRSRSPEEEPEGSLLREREENKKSKEKQGQRGTKETAGKPLQTELHCRARAGPAVKLWPKGI